MIFLAANTQDFKNNNYKYEIITNKHLKFLYAGSGMWCSKNFEMQLFYHNIKFLIKKYTFFLIFDILYFYIIMKMFFFR